MKYALYPKVEKYLTIQSFNYINYMDKRHQLKSHFCKEIKGCQLNYIKFFFWIFIYFKIIFIMVVNISKRGFDFFQIQVN